MSRRWTRAVTLSSPTSSHTNASDPPAVTRTCADENDRAAGWDPSHTLAPSHGRRDTYEYRSGQRSGLVRERLA